MVAASCLIALWPALRGGATRARWSHRVATGSHRWPAALRGSARLRSALGGACPITNA